MNRGQWRTLLPTGYMEDDTVYTFVRDFQGNVRLVVREDGEVAESNEYYPYGMPFDTSQSVQPYKYGGKELDRTHGLDWYDFGARMLDPTLARWTSPDPLSEKYYHLSPYAYCAGNPIKYIDPDGMKFQVTDILAQSALRNTVPKEDRKYIQFGNDGTLNTQVLFSHNSNSFNYQNIREIELSTDLTTIEMNDNYNYMDNEGNILNSGQMSYSIDADFKDNDITSAYSNPTGEMGKLGVTLLPGIGKSGVNSVDNNIHIILNKNLSTIGAAANVSHELFGHGLMYIRSHDRVKSGHQFQNMTDQNKELINLIYQSLKETIENLKE